jgi:multidrug efflux pump subunit AcrB
MNFSYPFIMRPVGTTLLALGLLLVGIVAYRFLPVASMPNVELPTIRVSASRPGADPAIIAATVAAPLERHLATIAGVTEITSVSSLGQTSITVQFDLARKIEGAARDVQAAINASLTDLPSDLPSIPSFRKFNPAASPVLILALTSKTVLPSAIYDAADTVVAQRIAQVAGVADVTVSGAEQPAVRVRINPGAVAYRSNRCATRSPAPTHRARSACSTAASFPRPSASTISCAARPTTGRWWSRATMATSSGSPTSPRSSRARATAAPPPGSTSSRRCC